LRRFLILLSCILIIFAGPMSTFASGFINSSGSHDFQIETMIASQSKVGVGDTYVEKRKWEHENSQLSTDDSLEDTEGPVLESIEFNKTVVELGEELHIKIKASDESGVSNVIPYVRSPIGKYQFIEVIYNEALDVWEGIFVIEKTTMPGSWGMQVNLYDDVGNATYSEDILDLFTVINQDGDWEGPEVELIDIYPKNASPGDIITIKVQANDASNVLTIEGSLYNKTQPVNNETIYFILDEEEGLWIGTYKVKNSDPSGEWSLSINAFDELWNRNLVYFNNVINIHNPYPDYEGPILEVIQISPQSASVGEEIYFEVKAVDSKSEISHVYAYMEIGLFDLRWSKLTYNEDTDSWIGSYTVKINDREGSWHVYIYAEDEWGNSSELNTDQFIEIINPDFDDTEPEIGEVQISNLSPSVGEKVIFKVPVHDNKGVEKVQINLAQGWDNIKVIDLQYNSFEDLWVGEYQFSEEDLGYWLIIVSAWDIKGNFSEEITFTHIRVNPAYISENYGVAHFYYSVGNLYNAVYYAGLAIAEGDTRAEVRDFMNLVSYELFEAAGEMSAVDAMNAYQLLVETVGVPEEIKEAAASKLGSGAVESPNYGVALWYESVGNYYNAVYYAGVAIADGDTREELQVLMNRVAQSLLETAKEMSALDAMNAYQLLVDTVGVPEEIKAEAASRLGAEVIGSPYYGEALWYESVGNLYNAVYYAGLAIAEGDTREEVLVMMNRVAQSLLEAAKEMSALDAMNAYQLLVDTVGVPEEIKAEAASRLGIGVVGSPYYGEALWYESVGNLYNAVYYVGLAIADGDTREEVLVMMDRVAQSLLEAAEEMSALDALNAYQLLVDTEGVPAEIKEEAQRRLNN